MGGKVAAERLELLLQEVTGRLAGCLRDADYVARMGGLVEPDEFLARLGGDEFIERILTGIPLGSYGIMAVILAAIFLLGFFLDWIEITLIILPLIAPVVSSLGFEIDGYGVIDNPELVWFVVLIAVSLQTSFLTPPVGFALFYLKGICPPEIQLVDIYKGVIPFIILQLTGLLIIAIWPQLVIWSKESGSVPSPPWWPVPTSIRRV